MPPQFRLLPACIARGRVLEVVSPQFRGASTALEPLYPDFTFFGRRIHVFTDDPERDRPRIAAALAEAEVSPAEIRVVPMSMDEVFVTFIEREGSARAAA